MFFYLHIFDLIFGFFKSIHTFFKHEPIALNNIFLKFWGIEKMAEKLIKSFFSFEFEVFGKVQGKF